eukprot:scpid111095/ scgid21664/ 
MDRPKQMDIDYSLKNVPIPTAKDHTRSLIERVEDVVKRMRWKAFFYLNGSDSRGVTEENTNKFGFKTKNCPPQIRQMKPFEDDLGKMNSGRWQMTFRISSKRIFGKLRAPRT